MGSRTSSAKAGVFDLRATLEKYGVDDWFEVKDPYDLAHELVCLFYPKDVPDLLASLLLANLTLDDPQLARATFEALDVNSHDGRVDLDGYPMLGGDRHGSRLCIKAFSELPRDLEQAVWHWLDDLLASVGEHEPDERLVRAHRYWTERLERGA